MRYLVYNLDVRVIKWTIRATIVSLLGAIILVPNGVAAAQEATDVEPNRSSATRLRSAGESEELITALSSDLLEAQSIIASNSSELESVESSIEQFKAELLAEMNDLAAPVVEGFINSELNTGSDRAPNAELRARFISGEVITQDEVAVERINDLQRGIELTESRAVLLNSASAELETRITTAERALQSERLSLSRANQRAIFQRGRDGISRTITVAQVAAEESTEPPVEVIDETADELAEDTVSAPPSANLVSGATYLATCPVAGPHNAIDSYGAPRSSGRTHDGIDILANVGVPIAAPASGQVELVWGGNIGGNIFRLTADNGVYYYGAHLDSFEGTSRRVSAGEIIGYVGKTGNAQFTPPHLHFEIRPGGRGAAPVLSLIHI